MNAPVLRSGTITIQWACSSISLGIPLSGADMTSENTAAAAFNRLVGSASLAMSGVSATAAAKISFISFDLFRRACGDVIYQGTCNPDCASCCKRTGISASGGKIRRFRLRRLIVYGHLAADGQGVIEPQ